MEQNIPIDIHTNKLLDWLISRRHVNRDWQTQVLVIREKINNAIQDMPVHEGIAKLLSGSYINYFHCKKIIDILKETEASSKNFFGSYGSQRMKDWQEIVKLYEKDNVYLAEVAQMLIRNVNYEVPSIKKQIAKCKQLQECDKKEKGYLKTKSLVLGEFQTMCKQLGIPGQKIKHELAERVKELPEIYTKVADNAKLLSPAVEFYSAFVKFVLGEEHTGGSVSLLKYIIDHGNTTTYEWMYGEPPLTIEETPLDIDFSDEIDDSKIGDTIDFGDDNTAEIDFGNLGDANANEIDFGDVTLDESGDIDWGNINNAELAELPDANLEIDFNISLEESGIVVESTGVDGGVAKGTEALTLLDNPKTRNTFIDDLMELQAFLKVRLFEMQGASDLLSLSQLQDASPILQLQTTQSVLTMLDHVQITLGQITDSRTQHLHNIKHSPRYVDHLVDGLKQKLAVAKRMEAAQEVVKERRHAVGEEAASLQPKMQLIIDKTKELQSEIEEDISKKYKNRPVNIMGGVNIL
ncbi:CDK5 regulatory subunit-associated protein 3 isoform X2 [Anabrus simplex]|uniref:CDK5 regulatory subunit-associated protein 3 isoform X2 n=1 Tax=Anabrus simplex TaxID=316456 RepID=UPI0034DD8384